MFVIANFTLTKYESVVSNYLVLEFTFIGLFRLFLHVKRERKKKFFKFFLTRNNNYRLINRYIMLVECNNKIVLSNLLSLINYSI